jgi:predicted transcriptional regulator of viral defense system
MYIYGIMNKIEDTKRIAAFGPRMAGVFSISDLKNLFQETDRVRLNRRVAYLLSMGTLSRFARGFYTTGAASLETLCMRMHEDSYLSLATALAKHLMIGTVPAKSAFAVKPGRTRTYSGPIGRLVYVGIQQDLLFGFEYADGVRYATPEKALLDTLYFYQKGRRYFFNIFGDINLSSLNAKVIREFLKRYKNPRFVTFVERYLDERLS